MKKLKAAIIGCGAVSTNHTEALAKCKDADLAAVCDIDEQKASKTAEKYKCRYYTDYKRLLKDEEIDVVHICTPHFLHAPMAVEAMWSGKHVLTEKPTAISISDVQEMIQVSEETGKRLGVCFQNRYNLTSLKIKELIDSGKVGKVIGAKAFVTWHRDEMYYKSAEWRGTLEKEGGGVLINQAIHTLDLLQWFIGDINKIKGSVDTRLLEKVIEVEDTAEATIIFKNGATAVFYATNCYHVNSPVEIELVCENAILKMAEDLTIVYNNGEIEHVTENNKVIGEKFYWGDGHMKLTNDFYCKLVSGNEFSINGVQGLVSLKMIEAIYRSHKTKDYVSLTN